MVPLGLGIKGCDFFIFVRAVDENDSQRQGSFQTEKSHMLIKMYWEIGATAPFFRPQTRKKTPVGHLPEGNGSCQLILRSHFSKPHMLLQKKAEPVEQALWAPRGPCSTPTEKASNTNSTMCVVQFYI
jgi:hypothetical protein